MAAMWAVGMIITPIAAVFYFSTHCDNYLPRILSQPSEVSRGDSADEETEAQRSCCLPRVTGHCCLDTPLTAPFLLLHHNHLSPFSWPLQKSQLFTAQETATFKLENSAQVQGSKEHVQQANPLKMQIPLTLISNIYTHAFTHANEQQGVQDFPPSHSAQDSYVQATSSKWS